MQVSRGEYHCYGRSQSSTVNISPARVFECGIEKVCGGVLGYVRLWLSIIICSASASPSTLSCGAATCGEVNLCRDRQSRRLLTLLLPPPPPPPLLLLLLLYWTPLDKTWASHLETAGFEGVLCTAACVSGEQRGRAGGAGGRGGNPGAV